MIIFHDQSYPGALDGDYLGSLCAKCDASWNHSAY